jgi:hypothetical protein
MFLVADMLKIYGQIKSVMSSKTLWASHEIQKEVAKRWKLYSESTITRRMRDG